jgi:rod shape-determining protein MreD
VRNSWVFGVITFLAGWLTHVVLTHAFPSWLSPHWLLLFVLGLGSLGWTNLAQSLGFFWGLSLDVFGMGLFGTQAWLLCLAGFLSGRFSRQLNAEKLATQEALALIGTAFFWTGVLVFESVFRSAAYHREARLAPIVLAFIFNAAVAPGVFWATRRWAEAWRFFSGPPPAHG